MAETESLLRAEPAAASRGAAPPVRWARLTDPRVALGAFAAVVVVAFPVLLRLGSGSWFTADDWDFLSARTAGSVGDLFRPHFQHWTTLPILAYRLLFNLVGLRSYVPYQALVVALHLTAVVLLRAVMRRAGVRPWTATVFAAAFVFFAAGAENILVAFQIAFVGAFVCGLGQLLLADHDGPIDRRDRLGLLAGFAGLMFSGVAITMTIVVGVAVLVRRGARGWRVALFHTGPLALAYVVWSALAPKGQSAGAYRSQSLLQVLRFVEIGMRTTFAGLGRVWSVGVVLGVVLVAGTALLARAGGLRALRGNTSALTALAIGVLVFLFVTGLARSGQPGLLRLARGTGPSRAKESRYLYLVGGMVLPALALAADAIVRRWRLLTAPVLLLPLLGLPANVHRLDGYVPYYRTLDFERYNIVALPHVPLADQFRGSRAAVPFTRLAPEGLTIGWIIASASSLPAPLPGPKVLANSTLRFALAPALPDSSAVDCVHLRGPVTRTVPRGRQLTIEFGKVLVRYVPSLQVISSPIELPPSTVRVLAGPLRLRFVPESRGVMLCE